MSKLKYISLHTVVILLASVIAIAVHALMPADTNVEDFDSILVKALTFPVVASLYFILLFTHCAITVSHFGKNSNLSGFNIGLRFGTSFAIMYLLGMQEVVLSASPYSEWGKDFFVYQLIMGISDAIPALLMCIVIGKITLKKNNNHNTNRHSVFHILSIVLIASTFTVTRVIGYHTGIVSSDLATYPIQTYIWTILFGLGIGIVYVLLRPIFQNEKMSVVKLSFLTIGLNWMIFNSFIGLIFKGLIWEMILRSLLDIIPFCVITMLLDRYFRSTIDYKMEKNGNH